MNTSPPTVEKQVDTGCSMRYAFRLAELLGHTPDRKKRPGTIKAIVEYTGLDRHQVAALLKNEAKYIPLEALSRLCDYLIEYGYASAAELPGALFAVKPENFWELLARRRRLDICVGVRRPPEEDSAQTAWIVASDSVLLGEVLNGVSTLGGTAKVIASTATNPNRIPPHPEHLRQSLVWSPGTAADSDVVSRAQQVYEDFSESSGDKALVALGSVKSNPIVELIYASAFNATSFESQDDVAVASDRKCPFFLRYRDNDPQPASFCSGLQLSKKEKSDQPGLYYEQEDGTWEFAGGATRGQDAALVFYIYREALGQLEMVLSGFSGRATRLLARTLARSADYFWPPIVQESSLQVGAYIIQFEASSETDDPEDILRTDILANSKVIPLPAHAIARRME
jgi:Cro/C1-type HTH DNA-binding domain